MEIENLFNEWSIAYRAKGGKITVSEEELFADFFRWLKSKAAEQSVHLTALRGWLFGWFTGALAGFGIAYYLFGGR